MPLEKTTALLQKVPGPDNQSLHSVEKVEQFEKTVAALLDGGEESVHDLVSFLRPRSDTSDENAKARFVIHAMAIQTGDDAAARRKLSAALASSLSTDQHPAVAAFVVRQLQVCGDAEQAAAVGKFLTHEDRELADTAARALVTFGAVEPLRAALPKVQGANRPVVIQSLGVLGDRRSVGAIREALNDEDQQIRLTACAALANIGDAASADAMVKAAKKESGFAQAQARDACLRLAEKLEAAGNKSAGEKIRSSF